MFSVKYNIIDPFVTQQANIVMKNIGGNPYYDDWTPIALLRALLFERMKNEQFTFNNYRILEGVSGDKPTVEILDSVFQGAKENSFTITNVDDDEGFKALADALPDKAVIEEKTYGLTPLNDISDWMKNKANLDVRIYINQEKNSAYIFARKLTTSYMHLLLSLTPRYLPKHFVDKPLQPWEREVLATLTARSGNDFLDAIAKVADHMDLREAFLRGMVLDFEKRETETLLKKAEQQLQRCANDIQSTMEMYANAIRAHEEQMYRVEGIRAGVNKKGDNSELLQYLLQSKTVELINVDGNRLELEVRSFLDLYDQDVWDRFSSKGEIYDGYDNTLKCFTARANRKLLLDAIFSETPQLRLKMCAYYYMDLNGRVDTSTSHRFKSKCEHHMVNPHLRYHACLGSNRQQISTQLTNGEIIGAIECAVSSCKAVNMNEVTQTFKPMIRDIFREDKKKIFLNADGEDMTPEEALNWLKNLGKKKNKE